MVPCLLCEKWEAGVWNQGTSMILLFIDIILRSYTRSYNIQSFSYPDLGVVFEKYIWSRSHKLVDVDLAGTLDSCSGKNEQKNTHNSVIEVEIIKLST